MSTSTTNTEWQKKKLSQITCRVHEYKTSVLTRDSYVYFFVQSIQIEQNCNYHQDHNSLFTVARICVIWIKYKMRLPHIF